MKIQKTLVSSVAFCLLGMLTSASAIAENGKTYFDLGIFAWEEENFQEARDYFKKAVSVSPDHPLFNQHLGKTYFKLEHYPEALEHLTRAKSRDPSLAGLSYDLGVLYYHMAAYDRASEILVPLFQSEPFNRRAALYAGMSLYKTERYAEASPLLMSSLEEDPALKSRILYYAAICDARIGRIQSAIEKFADVVKHADSDSMRMNSQKWIEALMPRSESPKPLTAHLKIGYSYDDNAVLESPEGDTPKGKEDWATKVFLSGEADIFDRNALKFQLGFTHYQTWHHEHSDLDIVADILHMSLKYRVDPVIVGLSFFPTYYAVNNAFFLSRYQIQPHVNWRISDHFMLMASCSHHDNDYDDDGSDGNTREMKVDAYCLFPKGTGYAYCGADYEINTASDSAKDYDEYAVRLGMNYRCPWRITIMASGKYGRKTYDSIDRTDDKYEAFASISRPLYYDWLEVSIEYDYTRNDSDIDDYEYRRNGTGLFISGRY